MSKKIKSDLKVRKAANEGERLECIWYFNPKFAKCVWADKEYCKKCPDAEVLMEEETWQVKK